MRPLNESRSTIVDVGPLLDKSKWTPFHTLLVLFAMISLIFDGFDTQTISFALPSLIHTWNVPGSSFAFALAIGLLGASLGNMVGGFLSDRFGRRPALVVSLFLFGIFSAATAAVNELVGLTLVRLLASIGLGCAVPAAMSLVAEVVPISVRFLLTSVAVACFPLGGAIGGVTASQVLPQGQWRLLFLIGGGGACLLSFLAYFLLPESPRFLVGFPKRWPELRDALARLGYVSPADAIYIDSSEKPMLKASARALFSAHLRGRTIPIWIALSGSLFAMQLIVNWAPTLLASRGLNLSQASLGLSIYNLGGVAGALICAVIGLYLGCRVVATAAFIGAIIVAQALSWLGADTISSVNAIMIIFCVQGFFSQAAQTSLAALSVLIYPTSVRATGSGAAIAVGRGIAAIVGAMAGPPLIALGIPSYFQCISASCLVTVSALYFLRIPAVESRDDRL